jgi:hypothetical protein
MPIIRDTVDPQRPDEFDDGNVPVSVRVKPVLGYVVGNPEPVKMGDVISRRYRGEQAQRHVFRDVNGKQSRMGVTTTQFRFVSHDEVLNPLVKMGWDPRDIIYSRGGQHMMAILRRPDGLSMEDPMVWDHNLWQVTSEPLLHESLIIRSSVRPGRGYSYARGIFRTICVNGLEVSILNLGRAKFTHTNWSAASVVYHLGGLKALTGDDIWGPYVGNRQGATRLAGVLESVVGDVIDLEAYNQSSTPEDDDGDAIDQSRQIVLDRLPLFVRNQAVSIVGQPSWYLRSLAKQLRMASDSEAGNEFRALHISNIVTNAANLGRRHGHQAMRPMLRAETITMGTMNLIGAMSL